MFQPGERVKILNGVVVSPGEVEEQVVKGDGILKVRLDRTGLSIHADERAVFAASDFAGLRARLLERLRLIEIELHTLAEEERRHTPGRNCLAGLAATV